MTTNRIASPAPQEKGRHQTAWPPSLARECRYYGDVFLEHDAERLAEVAGLSRREVNRLREVGCFEGTDGEQRLQPVEKVARLIHAAAAIGMPHERIRAFVRPITDALTTSEEETPRIGVDKALELLVRECAEAAAEIVAARPGGYTPFERTKLVKALREARIAIDRMENEIDPPAAKSTGS